MANASKVSPQLTAVVRQLQLPEYAMFVDFSEMASQFGLVVLFSVAWPLSPLFAMAQNWMELRSDAVKIAEHHRRIIPRRVETIGPWLEVMVSFEWW